MSKEIKKFIIKSLIAIIAGVLVGFIIISVGNNNGKGSVPITTGTEDISVDVCINQDCEYVADGQNDEREIKQAISAVLSAGGGTVNIRQGNYDISSSINVTLTSGQSLTLKGDGYNTKLTNSMTSSSEGGTAFVIGGAGTSTVDSIAIRDIQFVGSSSGGMGVKIDSIHKIDITSNKFTGFSSGATWGMGLSIATTSKTNISGNTFASNFNDIEIGTQSYNTLIFGNNFDGISTTTISANASGVRIIANTNLGILSDGGASNSYILDSNVNLGIGTSSPSTKLDLYDSSATTTLKVDGSGVGQNACIKVKKATTTGYIYCIGTQQGTLSCSDTSCE